METANVYLSNHILLLFQFNEEFRIIVATIRWLLLYMQLAASTNTYVTTCLLSKACGPMLVHKLYHVATTA